MTRILQFTSILLLLNLSLYSQVVSNLDCIGATPICVDMFDENIVPDDEGFFTNEINPEISCAAEENKAIWYIFTVNKTGDFGFLITPASSEADYDWGLFNLTNASCADIFDDASLVVSCNSAGNRGCEGMTGATGGSNFNIQGGNCNNNPPNGSPNGGFSPFNDLISVVAGNTYVLYVSNFNSNPNGYVIDFSLSSDIGIFDQDNPSVEPLPTDAICVTNEIPIIFSEKIKCATIGMDNINIPGIPSSNYTIFSEVCEEGGTFDNEFMIEINTPINTTGEYVVEITPNAALPILDLCDNGVQASTLRFRVDNEMPGPTLIGIFTDNDCQINEVTVTFSDDILCSGLNSNSFTVIAPDGTRLNGETVLTGCELSSEFIYRFDQPIVDNGDYELFLNSGQGLTFTNECLKPLEGAMSSFFTKTSADNTTVETISIVTDCSVSEIVVPFNRPIQCNTITDSNVEIEFMGTDLPGIISDTDCSDRGSLMLLTQVTYALDDPITTSGTYQVNIISNGVDELVTDCGSSVMSSSQTFNVSLDIEAPIVTSINFPDSCNIQTLSIEFSEPVTCDNAIGSGFSLTYNQANIDITGTTNCGSQTSVNTFELNIGQVINSDGEYTFSQSNQLSSFTDACGVSPEPFNLIGNLTFDDCDSCFIYIPTAFSPNGDNINEELGPLSNCAFTSVDFSVFDRWGNLVFTDLGVNQTNMWNGFIADGNLNPGVYAYVMEIQLEEFKRLTTRTRRGTFTILK